MEAEAKKMPKLVEVTLIVDDEESGESKNEMKEIPKGETAVAVLKEELGVPAELALWVIRKNGKRKQLADHETHEVKAGDTFMVITRGGIS
jgi:hypothetical protein